MRIRAAKLQWLLEDEKRIKDALEYYRQDNIADFIEDWGQTFDPRNVAKGQPTKIPFLLFPKQRGLVNWMLERWRASEPGLCDKSREVGVSWVMVGAVDSLCSLYKGFVGGFGSRKLELVDKTGSPDALFWKAREFMRGLPKPFRGGWDQSNDASGRITFGNGSVILGEGGDNIGRGGRTSIYVVDEAAYIEHPELIDASLSATTLCRIDVSSAHGMANSFAKRRHEWPRDGYGRRVFTLHWRDDPRKDEAWYQNECTKWDPIVIAQELDINYMASVEGILIPSAWIQAAIDAHKKLNLAVDTGSVRAALDVADEGPDKNALCAARGIYVLRIEDWSGKNSNIYQTTLRAFRACDEVGTLELVYDADGMGASVRGDAVVINEGREQKIALTPFHGAPVLFPEREDIPGSKNRDKFASGTAQAWWALRCRFEKTFKAVTEGLQYGEDELICLDGQMSNLDNLVNELVQVQYGYTTGNKLQIIKTPEGMASPNMADALKMLLGRTGVVVQTPLMSVEKMLVPNVGPVDWPKECDAVYAVVVVSTKARDRAGAGVTYFAHTDRPGVPLTVLEWDLTELNAELTSHWLPRVYQKLEHYARACRARAGSVGVWLQDETAGAVLMQSAELHGYPVTAITVPQTNDGDRDLAGDALSRALNVSGMMSLGTVRLSGAAQAAVKDFKGLKGNHLLDQIRSVSTDSELDSLPLLNSFTHGVLLGTGI